MRQEKYFSVDKDKLLKLLDTKESGLSDNQAKERLKTFGKNQITEKSLISTPVQIFLSQFRNWLVIVLLLASAISFFLGEHLDAIIVISIVFFSIFFGFYQEYRSEKTLLKLKKLVPQKTKVKRDNLWVEIESKDLVVGDIVKLEVGDVVAADIRLIKVDDLMVDESILTGESFPVLKDTKEVDARYSQPYQLKNMVFMGTSIVGGNAEGVVVATGNRTLFGKTASLVEKTSAQTAFQKETKNFSKFLFRVILLMTIFIFSVNTYLNRDPLDSLLFALALAVGITPELLPAIMTATLSQGALKMASKRVVVKRLISVEGFGNMDALCTDKTGTLTEGVFSLVSCKDENFNEEKDVFLKALLCTTQFASQESTSSQNPIDKALWQGNYDKEVKKETKKYKFLDYNEFDFKRRRMSVLVERDGKILLIVKGSPDSIIPISSLTKEKKIFLIKKVKEYEEKGYRVIAVAERKVKQTVSSKVDEKNLTFIGFLLFSDPVKHSAKKALDLFQTLGISIKIISGDSITATKNVINQLGLSISEKEIILGENLEGLSSSELANYALKYNFFARVTPELKYKIVASLNQEGNIVGFLGDGVNDAPALKAADVGIAVDSGAAVAKEAADIVLIKKDLVTLGEGIEAGRKTFANIMKYILNTISANYGNMFTVSVSSLFLKFLPLLPKQILLNNLLSDIPLFALATDNVDPELTRKPKKWNIKVLGRFMLYFGLISSFFDLALILPMTFLWKVTPEIFRTAWFIESSLSEILVTFAIRTSLPFYRSMASKLLIILSLFASGIVVLLPLTEFGYEFFEFTQMPSYLWIWIGAVLVGYFITTEIAKKWFFKKQKDQLL